MLKYCKLNIKAMTKTDEAEYSQRADGAASQYYDVSISYHFRAEGPKVLNQ